MTAPNQPAAPAGPAASSTTPTFTPPPSGGDPGQSGGQPSQQPGQPGGQPAGQGTGGQQGGQQPQQGQPGQQQPAGDQRPPWERNGETFDPERAWKKMQALEADARQARGQRDEHKTKLDEIERGKLSAQQQAEHDRDQFRSRAETAERELARHNVIAAKGLHPNAAEFLTGSTREELEASADRLLAWNPGARLAAPGAPSPAPGATGPTPPGRPAEALVVPAGGNDPGSQLSADDLDPTKLAARIPRGTR